MGRIKKYQTEDEHILKHRKLKGTICYVVINGAEGNIYGIYKNKKLAEEAEKIASYNLSMRGSNYSVYIEQSKLY
jgi:hypothetical protein